MPSARNRIPNAPPAEYGKAHTMAESARAIHQKSHSPYYTDHITEIDTSEQKPQPLQIDVYETHFAIEDHAGGGAPSGRDVVTRQTTDIDRYGA